MFEKCSLHIVLVREDGRVAVGVTGTIGGGGGGAGGGGATDIGSWCCWAVVTIVFRLVWLLCLMKVDKRDADIFSSECIDSISLPIIFGWFDHEDVPCNFICCFFFLVFSKL